MQQPQPSYDQEEEEHQRQLRALRGEGPAAVVPSQPQPPIAVTPPVAQPVPQQQPGVLSALMTPGRFFIGATILSVLLAKETNPWLGRGGQALRFGGCAGWRRRL